MTAAASAGRPWSLNRQAARKLVWVTRVDDDTPDVDTARYLLDVLGLVDGPEGRDVLPDDRRTLDLELLRLCPGDPPPDVDAPAKPIGPQPKPSFVPEGLRNPSPAALPRKRPPAAPPIEHGTEAGYRQHYQRGALPVCDDCQLAHDMEADVLLDEETPEPMAEPAPPPDDVPDTVVGPTRLKVADGPYITALNARDLFVDTTYQRPLDEARVARMARTWSPRMLGVLEVSDRGPGASPRYAIVNGQHRCAAAMKASRYSRDLFVVCNVHDGLDSTAEAALMYELDRGTKALSSWDKWKSRRGAGDTAVLAIEDVAQRHGYVAQPQSFGAVGAAEKLWKAGGTDLLDQVVTVLTEAYGAIPEAVKSPQLSSVGALLQNNGAAVDVPRLIAALKRTTPQQLRAQADSLRQVEGGALHRHMARCIAGLYNRGNGPRISIGQAR